MKPSNGFKKGQSSWNKGKKMSLKHRHKLSLTHIGKKPWNKGKNGYKTKPASEETKKKISLGNKGKKLLKQSRYLMSEAKKKNPTRYWLGKKRLELSKENHPNWKGGISKDLAHYRRNRRNLEFNAEGCHTFGEWELLKKQYGFKCPSCNLNEPIIKLTEDHIIPLSKGGSDYIENIQPLCRSCNSIKHTNIIKY